MDQFTGYAKTYHLAKKSEQASAFQHFHAWFELQTGHKIKSVLDDKGGEYTAKTYLDYLTNKGIVHKTTPGKRKSLA